MFDEVITVLLDHLDANRQFVRRPRPCDPFKLAILAYLHLHGTVSRHSSTHLLRVSNVPCFRRLCPSSSDALLLRPMPVVAFGDRSFLVAAAKQQIELPGDITATQMLTIERCVVELASP
jgi:hypothetical protein